MATQLPNKCQSNWFILKCQKIVHVNKHANNKSRTETLNRKRSLKNKMFSLCRLCAESKDFDELITEISELETKLVLCCGWNISANEVQMPSKACIICVERLEKSWCFAESVKAAENKLNKLVSEENCIETFEKTLSHTFTNYESIKLDPSNTLESENIDDTIDDHIVSNLSEPPYLCENYHSELKSERTNKKNYEGNKLSVESFLAQLDKEDRLADGTISVNGVAELENLFPAMKTMAWPDCKYKCDKCNRVLNGPHNFFAHNRSWHLNDIQNMVFECFYCESKHRREYNLSQHMAMRHFPHLKFR